MKVLIVSFRYAPFNSIGSNRVKALVKHFQNSDIEYKVITGFAGLYSDPSFKNDPNVHYFSWLDVKKFRKCNQNLYQPTEVPSNHLNLSSIEYRDSKSILSILVNRIKSFLDFFLFPDPYVTWAFSTIAKGGGVVKKFNPDVIISSSYPYSSHVVARYFSSKFNIRWFAELRDPWVNNHIKSRKYFLKDYLDKVFSKFLFKRVSTFITVSEVWKLDLISLYKKKAIVIRNGYEPSSSEPNGIDPDIEKKISSSSRKKILYSGSIFPDNQDIDSFILFFASSPQLLESYDFVYVGSNRDVVETIIEKYGCDRSNFILFDKVAHGYSLWMQGQAEILLLLNWKNGSPGIIPGKFYEYIGANKPILLWNSGVENELLRMSVEYNHLNNNQKIIIIDNIKGAVQSIVDFKYCNETKYSNQFSRNHQFEFLIKNLQDEI